MRSNRRFSGRHCEEAERLTKQSRIERMKSGLPRTHFWCEATKSHAPARPCRFTVSGAKWSLVMTLMTCLLLAFLASPAAAQLVGNDTAPGDSCAGSPTGATRMTADADQDGAEVVLTCDGSTWHAAAPGPVQVGDDTTSCTPTIEGRLRYRSSGIPWQYCDGSAWTPFQQPRCTDYITGDCFLNVLSPDHSANDPDFIAANIKSGVNILGVTGTYAGSGSSTIPLFVDIDNLALSTVYESDIEQVNPVDGSSISITGDGSPQYRICDNADCSTVSQTWTASAGTINRGQYVQLRATSAASQGVQTTVTLSYAGSDALWHLKTTILNCLTTNTVTFDYTGSVQTLSVDNYSTECTYDISIYGAGGGESQGGAASFTFKPGITGDFNLLVGERGGTSGMAIAYGGGGGTRYSARGGGGASAIKFETTLLAISGGGGGGINVVGYSTPGQGGSLNNCGGDEGDTGGYASPSAKGGCNNSGGAVGGTSSGYTYGSGGSNGSAGVDGTSCTNGGDGYSAFKVSGGGCGQWSSGGGGYGGGGGNYNNDGGGGGGGYLNTSAVEAGYSAITPLAANSDGKIIVEWKP